MAWTNEQKVRRIVRLLKRRGWESTLREEFKEEMREDAYREDGWRIAQKEHFDILLKEAEKFIEEHPNAYDSD